MEKKESKLAKYLPPIPERSQPKLYQKTQKWIHAIFAERLNVGVEGLKTLTGEFIFGLLIWKNSVVRFVVNLHIKDRQFFSLRL